MRSGSAQDDRGIGFRKVINQCGILRLTNAISSAQLSIQPRCVFCRCEAKMSEAIREHHDACRCVQHRFYLVILSADQRDKCQGTNLFVPEIRTNCAAFRPCGQLVSIAMLSAVSNTASILSS
jgi:hypothetical protein